jgi:prepilin peptidase CpaA
MGAGDVKLMAALGALLGPAGIFKAWLFTAMAGGVYALALLVIRRGNGNHLMNGIASLYTSAFLALSAKSAGSFALANNVGRPKLCYGVAIAAGTLLSLFIQM